MAGARDAFEILDLLVDIEPGTLRRRPVVRDDIVEQFTRVGDRRSARLVGSLPATGGVLDEDHVDGLVVAVHREIQRLAEEFRHGARMAALLAPVVTALRETGIEPPIRVVDVGCASGYVVRWLAAHRASADVELVGVDHHAALIDEARALARAEHLPCRFEVQDAFALEEPAHVLISTGILHHFRGRALDRFFASHERSGVMAFVHVDFQPSAIAPLGAWLFHRTRMRLAISRVDGVASARRAHPADVLTRAVSTSAPTFTAWLYGQRVRGTPLPCVLTTLVAARGPVAAHVADRFAARSRRLEPVA